MVKLGGELATAEIEGELLVAGGGAANAVCLHRARAAALGGFEFACAIPGTVGGGVWMNAGAYGSDWAGILERALVVDAEGSHWLTPAELGLSYRHSGLRHGQVVARAEFRLEPKPEDEIKATIAGLQALRKAAQPTNKRTFGSVFKNPEHSLSAGRLLEACGLKGHRIGGAQISPRHANFIENADGARSEDAIALMAEARRRAREQYGVELEHEVQLLGPLELALSRSRDGHGESLAVPERRPQQRARAAVVPFPSGADRAAFVRLLPSGRSLLIGFALVAAAAGLYTLARVTPMFAVQRIEVEGAPPAVAAHVARPSLRSKGRA